MALSTQPYKGARDFYPEDKRIQKYMFSKLRTAVERFGYEEYDAPILEPFEIYAAKTGDEIVNEQTYSFDDRGGRKVVIRPEMTPTVSRMVAGRRQQLTYPLRWYSIPNLWRYERPQRGRYREHWQLNVDIFGVPGIEAEYEMIKICDAIFRGFGAAHKDYVIRLNSRKLVDSILSTTLGLQGSEVADVIRVVDRMHKLDKSDFIEKLDATLLPTSRSKGVLEQLLKIFDSKRLNDLPKDVQKHPSVVELKNLIDLAENSGIRNVEFDVTLMRGFDYYTDVVFEVFDTHPENNRSMMGGGRYDGLVGLFGVEPVATVGFGLGDATLQNFLELHHLLPALKTETQVYVALVGDVFVPAQEHLAKISASGVNMALGLSGKKLGDQFKAAEKKGIPYVLIIGDEEIASGKLTLKDLRSGKEHKVSAEELVHKI